MKTGVLGRAQKKKIITAKAYDLRDWATDRHGTIDDTPYGGGAGMVMKVDVVHKALKKIYPKKNKSTRVILLAPQGTTFNQVEAKRLATYKRLIFIAGRYEAIDARIEGYVDETISLGDFVVTGGELPAACIIDAVSRLIPGVVSKEESVENESFSDITPTHVNLEHPHYTRPEIYRGSKVPKILLSGDHAAIKLWRQKNSKKQSRIH
jgi:tRNA (guanine37-N1)-methyltransferase